MLRNFEKESGTGMLRRSRNGKTNFWLIQADLLYVSMVQFLSWLTSLCSVAWSFSDYSRAMKRGALSPSVSLVSRALILLSYISFIFVRINIFVFFIYILGSGPQQFFLGVTGIGVHAVLMGFLHLATSKIRKQKGESSCSRIAQILRSFLVNGLANIFFHNYVDHRCIVHKTHTFKRQFLFEVVLLFENIAVSVASCFFIPFKPFNDYTERNILFLVLSCIYIFALVCKLVYYKFFHIWKDVNAKFDRKNNDI